MAKAKLLRRSEVLRVLYDAVDEYKADFMQYRTEYERGELEAAKYILLRIKEGVPIYEGNETEE